VVHNKNNYKTILYIGLIDYKEFCDRFWIASENIEQPSGLKGMKSAFKRSRWLLNPDVSGSLIKQNSVESVDDGDREMSLKLNKISQLQAKPMGDLIVKKVSIYPKDLEKGIWPNSYNISDHGIVEVMFSGKVSQ
jgi:hypothetical protein